MPALTIDIEARFAKFQDALTRIERNTTQSVNRMGASFGNLRGALGGIAAALSAGAIVAGFRNITQELDNLSKSAQIVGTTVEKLSALQYAGGLAGLSTEDIDKGLTRLSAQLEEARQGGKEAEEVFRSLGVAINDGANIDEVLARIADRFASFADGSAKTAYALDLGGKSFAKWIPLLNEGREGLQEAADEAQRLGRVIDTDTAKAAEEFNDNIDRLKESLKGALVVSLADTIKYLARFSDEIVRAVQNLGQLNSGGAVLSGIATALETVAVIGVNTAYVLKGIGNELGGIAAQAGALARLDFSAVAEIRRLMVSDAEKARADVDALTAKILALRSATADAGAGGAGSSPTGAAPPRENKNADAIAAAFRKLDDQRTKLALEAEQGLAKRRLEIIEGFYRAGLASEESYWNEREQIAADAYAAESKAIADQIKRNEKTLSDALAKNGKGSKEYADALGDLEESQAKRNKLDSEFAQQRETGMLERINSAKAYRDELSALNAQLLELQGNDAQAARLRAGQQFDALRTRAQQRGDTGTEKQIDEVTRLLGLQADLNAATEDAAVIQTRLATAEERIRNSQATGAIGELEAMMRTGKARRDAVEQLSKIADEQERVAQSMGNPKLIADAEAFRASIEKLAAESDVLGDKMTTMLGDGFASFFNDVTSGTKSVKDAFKDLGRSLLAEVNKLIAQDLGRRLAKSLMPEMSGSGGGGDFFKFLSSIAGMFGGGGGSALSTPYLTPGFEFAGGGVMTPHGALQLRKYASGGIANSPQLALYGEGRMAEAYVPLPDGRRIPVAMQNGGGTNLTINVASGAPAEVKRAVGAGAREAVSMLRAASRYA